MDNRNSSPPPAPANEFAATTTRSPPARTGGSTAAEGGVRAHAHSAVCWTTTVRAAREENQQDSLRRAIEFSPCLPRSREREGCRERALPLARGSFDPPRSAACGYG